MLPSTRLIRAGLPEHVHAEPDPIPAVLRSHRLLVERGLCRALPAFIAPSDEAGHVPDCLGLFPVVDRVARRIDRVPLVRPSRRKCRLTRQGLLPRGRGGADGQPRRTRRLRRGAVRDLLDAQRAPGHELGRLRVAHLDPHRPRHHRRPVSAQRQRLRCAIAALDYSLTAQAARSSSERPIQRL